MSRLPGDFEGKGHFDRLYSRLLTFNVGYPILLPTVVVKNTRIRFIIIIRSSLPPHPFPILSAIGPLIFAVEFIRYRMVDVVRLRFANRIPLSVSIPVVRFGEFSLKTRVGIVRD